MDSNTTLGRSDDNNTDITKAGEKVILLVDNKLQEGNVTGKVIPFDQGKLWIVKFSNSDQLIVVDKKELLTGLKQFREHDEKMTKRKSRFGQNQINRYEPEDSTTDNRNKTEQYSPQNSRSSHMKRRTTDSDAFLHNNGSETKKKRHNEGRVMSNNVICLEDSSDDDEEEDREGLLDLNLKDKKPQTIPQNSRLTRAKKESIRKHPSKHNGSDSKKKQHTPDAPEDFIGSRVRKCFGSKYYEGQVMSYDDAKKWWKIKYNDGDEEEVNQKELADIIVLDEKARASPQNSRLLTHAKGKRMCMYPSEHNGSEKRHTHGTTDFIGTRVRKSFGSKYCEGQIMSYDDAEGNWKIKYDGGGEEKVVREELELIMNEFSRVPFRNFQVAKVFEDGRIYYGRVTDCYPAPDDPNEWYWRIDWNDKHNGEWQFDEWDIRELDAGLQKFKERPRERARTKKKGNDQSSSQKMRDTVCENPVGLYEIKDFQARRYTTERNGSRRVEYFIDWKSCWVPAEALDASSLDEAFKKFPTHVDENEVSTVNVDENDASTLNDFVGSGALIDASSSDSENERNAHNDRVELLLKSDYENIGMFYYLQYFLTI